MKLLRNFLTVAIILATLAAGVLFALQNKLTVPLDLLVYTFEPQSMALWILLAFTLGGILGMIISSIILMRTRVSLRSSRRQLDKTRDELSKLRGAESAIEAP